TAREPSATSKFWGQRRRFRPVGSCYNKWCKSMADTSLSERLAAVGELLVALAGSPVPSHQFQILADYTPQVLPCDYVALCLVAADGDGYYVHTLYAHDPDIVSRRLF